MSLRHNIPFRTGELPVDKFGLEIDSREPLITRVVTSAVTSSTRAILADVTESHTKLSNEVATLQKEVRLHRFQLDRLEQYGRRDSVRIHGLAETTGGESETAEGSTAKVISLAQR